MKIFRVLRPGAVAASCAILMLACGVWYVAAQKEKAACSMAALSHLVAYLELIDKREQDSEELLGRVRKQLIVDIQNTLLNIEERPKVLLFQAGAFQSVVEKAKSVSNQPH